MNSKWSLRGLFISFVLILTVDDTSAQTTCVIYPNLTTLAIRDDLQRSAEFHCQCTTGGVWFLPGPGSPTIKNFTIPPIVLVIASPFNSSNNGTYICSPTNDRNHQSRDAITLTATSDPGIYTHSTACNIISSNLPGLTAAGGVISNGTQNVILYCLCNRSDVAVGPSIWYINGDQVTLTQDDGSSKPYYRDSVPSPMIIPSFVTPYDGTYRCASGSLTPADKIADSIILALPIVITKNPMDKNISLYSNFTNHTLTCEAYGASSYTWERQNDVIPSDSTGVKTNALTLVNLQPEDAGNYRCVATNALRSDKSNYAKISISTSICIISEPSDTWAADPFCAEFNFTVKVYGYPTIRWYRNNDEPVPEKSYQTLTPLVNQTIITLTIPKVTSEDTGIYFCEVWANRMAVRSHPANLFCAKPPMRPPIVMTDSVVNLTTNNHSLVMKCLPNKINFNYEWNKTMGNQSAIERTMGIKSPQLTIINLKPEDSGDYRCIMSNRTGRIKSKFFTVRIIVILPLISEQPNSTDVEVYWSASFRCIAHGYGISISWKRVEHNMPITATVTERKSWDGTTSILSIAKVIGYYEGEYYCIAKNEGGTVMSQAAKLNVKVFKPEMITSLRNITVLPSHSFNLSCLAFSLGLLKYKWKRRDGILPQAAVQSYIDRNLFDPLGEETTSVYNLAVHNVQPSDEGWYCCVATNEAGSAVNCAWLEVNTLPTITAQPVSKNFTSGRSSIFAMSCLAVGVVPLYYRWEKYNSANGSWISPSHRVLNITSPNLTFSIVTKQDEGVYHCVVTSDDGSIISENATIIVYCPPINFSSHIISSEGEKVNLICVAANPINSLQINWYKGNDLVLPNDDRIITYDEPAKCLNSTLLLDPVNRTDDGVYTCRTFNLNGSFSESKINLTVEYPASVYIANKLPYRVTVGSLAILYCKSKGKPIPRVQWYKNDAAIYTHPSPISHQFYVIPTKIPHTTVYTCKGWNKIKNTRYISSANITVIVT